MAKASLWNGHQYDQWRRYAIGTLAIGVAELLKSALSPWVDQESPYLFFFAAVMVSAWHGGTGIGLFATLLAAITSDFFFARRSARSVALIAC